MHLHLKAALLSALVLPGLGQLYKKDRVKGIILLVLVNIFLICALFFVLQGMGQLILGVKFSGSADAVRILEELQIRYPGVRWLLTGFLVLWAYGVADALFAGTRTGRD
jgi:TM2 domain-containing membrane protein YozV